MLNFRFPPVLCVSAALVSSFGYGQTSGPAPQNGSGPGDIRDRNLYDPATDGAFLLSKKIVTNIVLDQKRIWASPFHANKQTARWWLIFGAGTAALIASDHRVSEQLPNTGSSVRAGTNLSTAGQYYSVYPFAGALYVIGLKFHDEKLAKTGALGVQALIDSAIVANVLKAAVRRERPLAGDGGGHFEQGGASFPSGHSIQAWTLASVAAKRYGNHKWVPLVSYAYASAVSVSRVSARQHFPSDVLAAGAMGFFIGRFVAGSNDSHEEHTHRRSAWAQPSFSPYLSAGGLGAQATWHLGAAE